MKDSEIKMIIASDVGKRDGIGVELSVNGKLLIEVFRDDTARTREVTIHGETAALEHVERCIKRFKDGDLWDFLDSCDPL